MSCAKRRRDTFGGSRLMDMDNHDAVDLQSDWLGVANAYWQDASMVWDRRRGQDRREQPVCRSEQGKHDMVERDMCQVLGSLLAEKRTAGRAGPKATEKETGTRP